MTKKELMLMGELYKLNDDKELNEDFMRARRLTRLFNSMTEEQMEERKEIIKELFKSTGENVHVEQTFHCDYGCHISVGENFYANYDCIMVDVCEIIIGDNVLLAPRVGIYTAGHPIDAAVRNAGNYRRQCVDWRKCGDQPGRHYRKRRGDRVWLCSDKRYPGPCGRSGQSMQSLEKD